MRAAVAIALWLLAACVDVAPAPSPLRAGDGIRIEDGRVSVDPARLQVLPDCAPGQLLVRGPSGWQCGDPTGASIDTSKTPVLSGCTVGQVVSWGASGWTCTTPAAPPDPANTPVVSTCLPGQMIVRTETGWRCDDVPAAADPARTPVVSSCQPGQMVVKSDNGWRCADVPAGTDLAALTGRVGALETRIQSLATSSYETLTATKTNAAPGQCVTIRHGWNTRTLGWSAWYSDPLHGWVSAEQELSFPPNLARQRPVAASSGADTAVNAVEGEYVEGAWISTSGDTQRWLQVDLGSVRPVGVVRVQTQMTHRTYSSVMTGWNVLVSTDGTTFGGAPAASASCDADTTCRAFTDALLAPGTVARYVRIAATAVSGNATVVELEVYPPLNSVRQTSADEIAFCNLTGATRDLVLRIWK